MSEQIEWEGYVERITFRNEENGYTVLFLVDAEEEEEEKAPEPHKPTKFSRFFGCI